METNDILIVKGFTRKINHKYLKAICLKSKEKKDLPESCAGYCHTYMQVKFRIMPYIRVIPFSIIHVTQHTFFFHS